MPDLDLSDTPTTWLNITYPPTDKVPTPTRVKLDFDEIALQFQGQCSRAFAPSSVLLRDIKDGLVRALYGTDELTEEQRKAIESLPDDMPAAGLFVAMVCKLEGKAPPPDVPDYALILQVARNVLRVPEGTGISLVAKALWFFVEQSVARVNAKKDAPSLPESAPVTPA